MKNLKPSKVEIIYTCGNYQLMVNNVPFYINGAGLEFGNIKLLSENCANSFRTWRVDNGAMTGREILDEASKYGLMVSMGIEVGRERHGFDYDDKKAIADQLELIKNDVLALKDHPSLLLWVIGNELNLKYENPKVWDAVNDISKMIHSVDPNHPTTTPLAGITETEINYVKERCSDLDCLSLQAYGEVGSLPNLLKAYNWTGPYIITEWGATGHWEVPKTSWEAPIEENSTIKAINCKIRYDTGIKSNNLQCLGSYIFLWGQKQERTPTWYGLITEDKKLIETVDVMRALWSGDNYFNRTPRIISFYLNNKIAEDSIVTNSNENNLAVITVQESDTTLYYKWDLLPESMDVKDGGDKEHRPNSVQIQIGKSEKGHFTFISPEKGCYRLFCYISNGENRVATANIPFRVL